MVCRASQVVCFNFFLPDKLPPFLGVVYYFSEEVESLVVHFVVLDVFVGLELTAEGEGIAFLLFHVGGQLGILEVDVCPMFPVGVIDQDIFQGSFELRNYSYFAFGRLQAQRC